MANRWIRAAGCSVSNRAGIRACAQVMRLPGIMSRGSAWLAEPRAWHVGRTPRAHRSTMNHWSAPCGHRLSVVADRPCARRRASARAGAGRRQREAPPAVRTRSPPATIRTQCATDAAKVPLDEIRRYVMVYNAVKQAYVDPVDDHALDAFRGARLAAGPGSAQRLSGEGRRARISTSSPAAPTTALAWSCSSCRKAACGSSRRSTTARPRAPACAVGDRIISIDGKPLGPGDADNSAPLRGAAGTKVTLAVVREGTPKPFDVNLVRETIRTSSVRSQDARTRLRLCAPGQLPGGDGRGFRAAAGYACRRAGSACAAC